MRRTVEIVVATVAAVLLIELMLQTALYRWLQPEILSPSDGAVVTPPVRVQWDGPPRMNLVLAADGAPAQALGMHTSPWELGKDRLSRPGVYRIRLQMPLIGSLIQSERRFVVGAPPPPPPPSPPQAADPEIAELNSSLSALRAAHEQTQGENAALHEEIAALRQENGALLSDIDRASRTQEDDAARDATQADRLTQLTQENQALTERMNILQWQLNAAMTCRLWGYYAFPRSQAYSPTRRTITVTNAAGEVFPNEAECERLRLADPAAASRCFCVGVPWSG